MSVQLTEGQPLWCVRGTQGPGRPVIVGKVGRRWADLKTDTGIPMRVRVDLQTLRIYSTGQSSMGRCYLSREEYETLHRAERAWSALRLHVRDAHIPSAGVTDADIYAAAALLRLDI